MNSKNYKNLMRLILEAKILVMMKQNYLVFQPLAKYLKIIFINILPFVTSWESKGFSNDVIKPPTTSNTTVAPKLLGDGDKLYLEFKGSSLKLNKSKFSLMETKSILPISVVSICIVYEITEYNPVISYPTLQNCLFGAIILTKNPDIDKYKYSGYGIGFDRKGKFSFGNGFSHNAIIF